MLFQSLLSNSKKRRKQEEEELEDLYSSLRSKETVDEDEDTNMVGALVSFAATVSVKRRCKIMRRVG